MSGKLVLIPTPIDNESPLEPVALACLQKAVKNPNSLLLVEELKECRRRWLRWGLPREAIERFIPYNEHTRANLVDEIVGKIKSGKSAFLMSDCGLPAFCDPGRLLVDACHSRGLKVSSTPFANSIALAVSLSGYDHDEFYFAGFLPRDNEKRKAKLAKIKTENQLTVIMDTPYRLGKLVNEISEQFGSNTEIFLGLNLNQPEELLLRGTVKQVSKALPSGKHEFILLIKGRK